jgi:Fe-S oxidoreductase
MCLSCKGCKIECPSGVDIAKMKAEFLQHWYDHHGIPLRSRLIAFITSIYSLGSVFPSLFNLLIRSSIIGGSVKRITGFAAKRSIPPLHKFTLRRWLKRNLGELNPDNPVAEVCLFIDEFTNFNDTSTGVSAVRLLTSLNYRIITVKHGISGRTFISKGLLRKAAKIAKKNVLTLTPFAERGISIIGIEPSAILGFREEYPDLLRGELKEKAIKLSQLTKTIDEFIAAEFDSGRIDRTMFVNDDKEILVHIHCQQKATGSRSSTLKSLSIPTGFVVREIPSGCCGMAGSFGYEKEHFELSNKIGELVLFPEVRSAAEETIISAPGTSCRHHIIDGTGRRAEHPVQVLYDALIKK